MLWCGGNTMDQIIDLIPYLYFEFFLGGEGTLILEAAYSLAPENN